MEPWRWEPWWTNAVRLGADCGEPFGCGLLRGAELEGVETLDLSAKLKKGSMAATAAVVELIKASSITSLNVASNALTNGEDMLGVLKLAEILPQSRLTSLNLDANQLGPLGGAAIAEGLKGNTTLKELTVGNNLLDVEGGKAFAAVLKDTQLTNLNLDNNLLCPMEKKGLMFKKKRANTEAITALSAALKHSSLTSLSLQLNELGPKGVAAIAKGLKGNTRLKELNVLNNKLGDGVDALFAAAREMPQLATLCGVQPEQADIDFSRRTLDAGDAKLLAFDLSKNKTIKSLNLATNNLTNYGEDMSGVVKLAEALQQSMLTSLNIGENFIGVEDGKAVAAVLKDTKITDLNVENNYLGVEGGKAFAATLKDTQLTNLNLASNQLYGLDSFGRRGTFTAEGITALCEGLKGSALTSLSLCNNRIGPKGGAAIAEGLKGNTTLQKLNLQYSELDDAAKQAVREAAGSGVELAL